MRRGHPSNRPWLISPISLWADDAVVIWALWITERPAFRCRFHACARPNEPFGQILRRRPIFLVCATRNDPQSVVRQWPLQCLGFIPRYTHPNVAFFIGHR